MTGALFAANRLARRFLTLPAGTGGEVADPWRALRDVGIVTVGLSFTGVAGAAATASIDVAFSDADIRSAERELVVASLLGACVSLTSVAWLGEAATPAGLTEPTRNTDCEAASRASPPMVGECGRGIISGNVDSVMPASLRGVGRDATPESSLCPLTSGGGDLMVLARSSGSASAAFANIAPAPRPGPSFAEGSLELFSSTSEVDARFLAGAGGSRFAVFVASESLAIDVLDGVLECNEIDLRDPVKDGVVKCLAGSAGAGTEGGDSTFFIRIRFSSSCKAIGPERELVSFLRTARLDTKELAAYCTWSRPFETFELGKFCPHVSCVIKNAVPRSVGMDLDSAVLVCEP